ncbi:hypothetical protein HDU76_003339 [Blyttiomyces sp. JEL0837]|nr:hypothetical protein HDU76_003339 [Blyttiomyces sp. JEL0837]
MYSKGLLVPDEKEVAALFKTFSGVDAKLATHALKHLKYVFLLKSFNARAALHQYDNLPRNAKTSWIDEQERVWLRHCYQAPNQNRLDSDRLIRLTRHLEDCVLTDYCAFTRQTTRPVLSQHIIGVTATMGLFLKQYPINISIEAEEVYNHIIHCYSESLTPSDGSVNIFALPPIAQFTKAELRRLTDNKDLRDPFGKWIIEIENARKRNNILTKPKFAADYDEKGIPKYKWKRQLPSNQQNLKKRHRVKTTDVQSDDSLDG